MTAIISAIRASQNSVWIDLRGHEDDHDGGGDHQQDAKHAYTVRRRLLALPGRDGAWHNGLGRASGAPEDSVIPAISISFVAASTVPRSSA